MFGILLGDGGLTQHQIKVTLHKTDDAAYALYVAKLMHIVFKEQPRVYTRKNVVVLTLSGVGHVEAVEKLGLRRGNKVKQQVGIPTWILNNFTFAMVCVRGLMDTDGGVYFHHHKVGGREYTNFGLSFTSRSKPILQSLYDTLIAHNFSPSLAGADRVYIYKLSEIKRYFTVFGSSNPKHLNRLQSYLNTLKK